MDDSLSSLLALLRRWLSRERILRFHIPSGFHKFHHLRAAVLMPGSAASRQGLYTDQPMGNGS